MNTERQPTLYLFAYLLADLDNCTFYEVEGDVHAYGMTSAKGAVANDVTVAIKEVTKKTGHRIVCTSPAIVKEVTYNV